jgi:hypothetical protein
MSNITRLNQLKALLQIHASTECLISCAREDGTSQLWLCIVPLPECSELDRSFHRKTVSKLWSIDRYQ